MTLLLTPALDTDAETRLRRHIREVALVTADVILSGTVTTAAKRARILKTLTERLAALEAAP